MEVKIKDGNGYVEAEWTIEDGVMVVSPKVEKYIPKDGDVVYHKGGNSWVFIYKDNLTAEAYYYVAVGVTNRKFALPDGGHIGYKHTLRPATEEEKQKLFDKLAEEGWEWKADTKELVKLKWKPKLYEIYYHPDLRTPNGILLFESISEMRKDEIFNSILIKNGWAFKTKEECQSFCDKLNQAISQIKP